MLRGPGDGSEVSVLADVSSLQQAVPVASILVLRPHPLKDLGQEEHDAALAQELLLDCLIHHPRTHVARGHELELMLADRVVVDAALDVLDVVDDGVRLDRVQGAR